MTQQSKGRAQDWQLEFDPWNPQLVWPPTCAMAFTHIHTSHKEFGMCQALGPRSNAANKHTHHTLIFRETQTVKTLGTDWWAEFHPNPHNGRTSSWSTSCAYLYTCTLNASFKCLNSEDADKTGIVWGQFGLLDTLENEITFIGMPSPWENTQCMLITWSPLHCTCVCPFFIPLVQYPDRLPSNPWLTIPASILIQRWKSPNLMPTWPTQLTSSLGYKMRTWIS